MKVSKNSWDAPYCAVNPKYIAIVLESAGGGSFLVLPLEKVGEFFDHFCHKASSNAFVLAASAERMGVHLYFCF